MIKCAECGVKFDPGDLTQVAYHEIHEPLAILVDMNNEPIKGKLVKKEAVDVGS